jgi:bifunctional UDP-N-acetylglucosamine pyrophosphorylase / glucosamine-1-phosphate N-acetyltransferase
MKQEMKAVILAAGKSKRMKSGYSKIVHKILGKEIINFLLDSLVESGFKEHDICVVCGENNIEEVKCAVKRDVRYAIQHRQLGTGDALLSAREFMKDFKGNLLVTVGDNPYITSAELKKLFDCHKQTGAQCTFISAIFPFAPPPYGRIIRGPNNEVLGVVEEIDATQEQLEIREVNSSIYLFDNEITFPLLSMIDNKNAKGEYYLTDIIALLKDRNHRVEAIHADDYYISIGINNRWELQEAQEKFNEAHLKFLAVEKGVTILQPGTVTVECDVEIGKDTVIYPSTYLASGTVIGSNCRIGPFVYLKDVKIEDNSIVPPYFNNKG